MTRRYTLAQLEYFVAVAEHGSMSGAARRLQVSQSAVSLAVLALERQLGTQLFHRRSAKGLSLTPAGQDAVTGARRLLSSAADFDAELAEGRGMSGPVRLGSFVPLSPFVIPGVLDRLRADEPGIRVQLDEGSLVEVQEALLDGRTELAITYDHDRLPGIDVERLRSPATMHAVLAEGHRLAGNDRVRVADLAQEDLIVVRIPPTQFHLERQLAELDLTARVRHTVASYELSVALAGRGLGCALLGFPPVSRVSIEGSPITAVPLDLPATTFSVVLARAHGARLGLRAQAVARAARQVSALDR